MRISSPKQTRMIPIIIIEEQILYRKALVSLINSIPDFEVIFEFNYATEFIQCNIPDLSAIIVHSVVKFEEQELQLINSVSEKSTQNKQMIISDEISIEALDSLKGIGIVAFISNRASSSELETILHQILDNNANPSIIIDSWTISNLHVKKRADNTEAFDLTPREKEILNLVCNERTNNEISAVLGLSVRTVETFRRRMIEKAGCKNMIGVIISLLKQGTFDIKHC